MRNLLYTAPVELHVGRALIPLVDERQAGDLLDRIFVLRQRAMIELGLRIPPIRIRDDVRLPEYDYVIRFQGIDIVRGNIMSHPEPADAVATRLLEILMENAAELLERRDVETMIDRLKKTHPTLVESVVPARISLGTLHQILQRLLRERVSVCDLAAILETLRPIAAMTKDPETLTLRLRRSYPARASRRYKTTRRYG